MSDETLRDPGPVLSSGETMGVFLPKLNRHEQSERPRDSTGTLVEHSTKERSQWCLSPSVRVGLLSVSPRWEPSHPPLTAPDSFPYSRRSEKHKTSTFSFSTDSNPTSGPSLPTTNPPRYHGQPRSTPTLGSPCESCRRNTRDQPRRNRFP